MKHEPLKVDPNVEWICDVANADLYKILSLCRLAQTPGASVEFVEETWLNPSGAAVIVFVDCTLDEAVEFVDRKSN